MNKQRHLRSPDTTKRSHYQSNQEITYDILEAALTAQSKTRIMYVAGLYNKQVNSYLAVLVRAGLLEIIGDRSYKTTVKGAQFMQSFDRLRSIAFGPEWGNKLAFGERE